MTARAHVRSWFTPTAVTDYVGAHSQAPDAVQRTLRSETQRRTGAAADMQIGDDQAAFMEILARATGARTAIEVGTFTGCSALALARGIGPEGRLLCCDTNEEWSAMAREFWQQAGVSDRIELRIGPALETLRSLPNEPLFDLAFVDADKQGYRQYHEELVVRMKPRGLMLFDNTLQGGHVADSTKSGGNIDAMRQFNEHIAADTRVQVVMLHIGDGVTIAQRR